MDRKLRSNTKKGFNLIITSQCMFSKWLSTYRTRYVNVLADRKEGLWSQFQRQQKSLVIFLKFSFPVLSDSMQYVSGSESFSRNVKNTQI
jgi:hypothetical protein